MRRYENWDYFPEKVIGLETRSAKLGNIWSVLGADVNPNWESMAVWLSQAKSRDRSRCAPSQWETLLQCDVSHWLGTYLDNIVQQWWNMQCNQDIKVDWWCILLTHCPLGDFNSILIFKLNLMNGGWGISCKIALRWMPLDLTDDKSTLVQVMAWCRQATSHYLSQCWPRSLSLYGITRPQWWKVLNGLTAAQFVVASLHSVMDTSCS